MYEHIARFYDLSHDRLVDDIPFLLRQAAEAGGPVLEIGCGSGRLLVPLIRAGFDVTGIDSSPEMLARAELRLAAESPLVRDRVRLIHGDIRTADLHGKSGFGLAVFGYNTFMHLDEVGAGAALKRLRPLLRADGLMVVDVAGPMLLASSADDPDFVLEDVLEDKARGGVVRQYTAYESIPGEQAIDVTWIYEAGDGQATNEQARTKTKLRYYYLYPHQFELLFALTGFRMLALYGDYDGSPFHEESERLILMAAAA